MLLAIAFLAWQPLFGTMTNAQNLARQGAVLAMMACGQLFVVVAGGIDISIGAQVSVLSLFLVDLSNVLPMWAAAVLTVLIGACFGLVNGMLIVRGRIAPIIATLATWQVLKGFSLWYTQGLAWRSSNEAFQTIGAGSIGPLATPTFVAISVAVLAWLVLNRTAYGRYVYAVGGNAAAARLSGISTRAVTVAAYVTCSVATAIATVVLASRVGTGLGTLGDGLEITTIAAVFIGGVAWGGGTGRLVGVLLGVALISTISNGLDLGAVSSDTQTVVTGVLMAVAAAANGFRRKGVRLA